MKYIKSKIIFTLIISFLTIFMPYYSYPLTKICLPGVIGQLECVNEEDLSITQLAQIFSGGSNIQCFPTGGFSDSKDDEADGDSKDDDEEEEVLCIDQNNLTPNNVNNPYANNNNIQCISSNNNEIMCFDTSTGSPYGNTGSPYGNTGSPYGSPYGNTGSPPYYFPGPGW